MKHALPLLALALTLVTLPVTAEPQAAMLRAPEPQTSRGSGETLPGPDEQTRPSCAHTVTVGEVLAMEDRAPSHEMGKAPFRWSHIGQANRIARAIAEKACSMEQAADLVVYDLFEGGNRLASVGDGGHSHGPWQLSDKRVPPEVARDPDQAAPVWLALAAQSRKDCASLPEDEQLAELASGSCDRGRVLTRRRAALRRRVLGE